MRTLILGGSGMLGRALVMEGRRRGLPILGLSRSQADIRREEHVRFWAASFRPEAVVNCAAFTQVDACEERRELAIEVNGRAVANAAAAARAVGARLVQISTDYVFDGTAASPYPEDAAAAPLSAYGESKLAGEREALRDSGNLVLRTSWLFGPGGSNFAATIVRLIRERNVPLRIVDDQVGCPTYTPFLARAIWDLLPLGLTGIVHYRNREPVSWHGFASEIARLWSSGIEVRAIPTAEMPRPARRPAYSVLDVGRAESTLGRPVEDWRWGLAEYVEILRREASP